MADGVVTLEEAQFLKQWISAKEGMTDRWPSNVLFARLCDYLEDGVLDQDEERDLLGLLMDIAGIQVGSEKTAVALPLCDPAPPVEFNGKRFVLTGKFASGTRAECTAAVEALGGICASSPSQKTDYLVIGELCSQDWIHENYGRKIESAVELREKGSGISIISERYWAEHLAQ